MEKIKMFFMLLWNYLGDLELDLTLRDARGRFSKLGKPTGSFRSKL